MRVLQEGVSQPLPQRLGALLRPPCSPRRDALRGMRIPMQTRACQQIDQGALRMCVSSLAQVGCLPRASADQRTLAVLTVGSLCLQFASPPPFGISVDVALPH